MESKTADKNRIYCAIDLKSFFASVECVERGLDPLGVNLVVADSSRTEKTICLAVSPSLKAYGISGRARLFEVVQKVREVNRKRLYETDGGKFIGKSYVDAELKADKNLELSYIVAPPQMAKYVAMSVKIYDIYKRFVSSDDIIVYSIDEVFIDITDYLKIYKLTPRELVMKMILEVLKETGITATAGIGTNLYLAKIAMDIVAKHIGADENGVRIAELDERGYREKLWEHKPITDFWRVGAGYAKRLNEQGLHTMGDIARCSLGKPSDYYNEELLYKIFPSAVTMPPFMLVPPKSIPIYTFSIFALPAEKFFYRFRVAFSPRAISFNILAFLFAFVKRKILNIAILTLQYCFFYFFLLFFSFRLSKTY